MRLRIVFEAPQEVPLPWNYSHLLHGLLYRLITNAKPELGHFLHEQGFVAGNHRYKMLVFSKLYPEQAKSFPEGLVFTPPINWWVSSPLTAPIEAIAFALLSQGKVRLGNNDLYVATVEVVPPPRLDGRVLCETISPVVASTGIRQGEKLHKKFLAPEDPDFWRVIKTNLLRKAESIAHSLAESLTGNLAISFEAVGSWRSRLLTSQGTKVKGYEGRFFMEGPERLLLLAYDAGIGERNSQGFGMFKIVSHR